MKMTRNNPEMMNQYQKSCKRGDVVYYAGDNPTCFPELARHILELYILGFGYSPIKHIVGLRGEKLIGDIVRQHQLGRKVVKENPCKMYCPEINPMTSKMITAAIEYMDYYGTKDDPYNISMMRKGRWWSDESGNLLKECPHCGYVFNEVDKFCANCGEPRPGLNRKQRAASLKPVVRPMYPQMEIVNDDELEDED